MVQFYHGMGTNMGTVIRGQNEQSDARGRPAKSSRGQEGIDEDPAEAFLQYPRPSVRMLVRLMSGVPRSPNSA